MSDPTTIEEQSAQLARWLDEHPGSTPPDGVDPDVLETIYALRPELAPAPSFSVDDILADITAGPFADLIPEAQADCPLPPGGELVELPFVEPPTPDLPAEDTETAEHEPAVVDLSSERRRRRPWLWSSVGAVAAAAMALIVAIPHLDSGISEEALYAPLQQPSSAPPTPTIPELVELEQTPVSKTASPHAERERGDATEASEPMALAEVNDDPAGQAPARLAYDPDPTQPALDAVTGGASVSSQPAAGPMDASTVTTPRSSSDTRTGEQGGERRQAKERKDGRSLDQTAPVPDVTGDIMDAPAAIAETSTYRSSATPDAPVGGLVSDGAFAAGSGAPPPPPAEPEEPAPKATAAHDLGGAEIGAVADAWEDQGAAMADFESYEDDDYDDRSRDRNKRDEAEESDEVDFDEDLTLSLADEPVQREEQAETLSAGRISASRSRGFGGGRTGRTAKARPESLEGFDAAPTAPSGSTTLSLDELRAGANPLDYRSDWYLGDPVLDPATKAQLAGAYGQAQASVVAGDAAAARAALEPLMSSAHPRVIQDATFRLATLQLQQGQRSTALATVTRGLSASNSPTVLRSRLLALRGSILEEQGDAAGAMDAYRQAMNANAGRY